MPLAALLVAALALATGGVASVWPEHARILVGDACANTLVRVPEPRVDSGTAPIVVAGSGAVATPAKRPRHALPRWLSRLIGGRK